MHLEQRRHQTTAIWAASVVATGLAMECHEWAHVVAGRAAGGVVTLVTTTETKGEFATLSPLGFVALGGAGFVANLSLATLGWWLLRRRPMDSGTQLFAWFTLTVNWAILATAMVGESAAGFGDWMTILQPWPRTTYLRALVLVLGAGVIVAVVRIGGVVLGRTLVPLGEHRYRKAQALRIILNGAAAATLLSLGGAVANPSEAMRSTLLALGAGLGPFLLLLGSVRHALRVPPATSAPFPRPASWLWYLGAAVMTLVMWVFLGPGVVLPS